MLEIAHTVYQQMPGLVIGWTPNRACTPDMYTRCELEMVVPLVYSIPSLETLQEMANFKYIQTNLHRYWTIPCKQAPRPPPALRQLKIRNYFRAE